MDTRVAYAEEGINDGAKKEAITIIRIKKVKIVRFKITYILHQHCLYNFELTYAPMLTIGYSTCILWTILSCIMCHELEGQQVEVPDQSHTCRLNNAFMCIKIILKYIKKLFKKIIIFLKCFYNTCVANEEHRWSHVSDLFTHWNTSFSHCHCLKGSTKKTETKKMELSNSINTILKFKKVPFNSHQHTTQM